MYLLFNKAGQLISQLVTNPIREGNDNENVIYAIFPNEENYTINDVRIKFKFSDGKTSLYSYQMTVAENCEISPEDFEYGIQTGIGKYLKYNVDYAHLSGYVAYQYTLNNIQLVNGKTEGTIYVNSYKNSDESQTKRMVLGQFFFYIENSLYEYSSEDEEYENLQKQINERVPYGLGVTQLGIKKDTLEDDNQTVLEFLDNHYSQIYQPILKDSETVAPGETPNIKTINGNSLLIKNSSDETDITINTDLVILTLESGGGTQGVMDSGFYNTILSNKSALILLNGEYYRLQDQNGALPILPDSPNKDYLLYTTISTDYSTGNDTKYYIRYLYIVTPNHTTQGLVSYAWNVQTKIVGEENTLIYEEVA